MISNYTFFKKNYIPHIFAFLLLILILLISGIPGYLSGNWQWKEPPSVTNLKEVKQIRKTGLNLSGWETVETAERQIGGQKWLWQKIKQKNSGKTSYLLLLPQNGPRNQPQTEWTQIGSFWRWKVAQFDTPEFTTEPIVKPSQSEPSQSKPSQSKPSQSKPSQIENPHTRHKIEANFFRAVLKNRQTYAVLQWYATPNGGSPSPFKWFFADQMAQIKKERIPWVAVNIMIPIEPLGEVKKNWAIAQSLGEQVQASLVLDSFREK